MYPYVGAAAGAIYGFNAANTRGAYKGAMFGWRVGKKRQGTTKKSPVPKRQRVTAGYGGTSRRRHSLSAKQKPTSGRKQRKRHSNDRLQSDAGVSAWRSKTGRTQAKGFKRMKIAPQILNSVLQGRITSALSRQAVENFNLYSGVGGSVVPTLLSGPNDIADMNTVLFATETIPAQQGAAGNSTATTRRMMVESVRCKVTMKNHTNSPIDVTLYDIVPKRDEPRSLDGVKPNFRWQSGLLNESVTIVGTANQNAQSVSFPGAKPFQSQEFCQFFTVKKVTHFVLGAGTEHIHYITIKPKFLFNNAFTASENLIARLTHYLMGVIKGPIAHDSGTGPTQVSYAPAVLDYITETQYRFRALEKNRTAYQQYSILPATLTAPQTVLEDADLVASVLNA